MRKNKTQIALVALAHLSFISCTQNTDSKTSSDGNSDDYIALFDGETLDGWRGYKTDGAPSGWVVENGVLTLAEPGGGDIMTKESFGDFDLELEWRISEGGNSGILYHVMEEPDAAQTYHTGLEMQVLDDERHEDRELASHRAGALYDLVEPAVAAVHPAGEWNEARVRVEDGRIEHWLNGELIVESPYGNEDWRSMVADSKFSRWPTFGNSQKGHIALQDHNDRVEYRNIRIKKL